MKDKDAVRMGLQGLSFTTPAPTVCNFNIWEPIEYGYKFRILDTCVGVKECPHSQASTAKIKRSSRSLTSEEWLDSVEAAAYLKISVGSLRNMTSNGHIPFHKLGSRNRYRTEELRQLLLSNARGVRNGY